MLVRMHAVGIRGNRKETSARFVSEVVVDDPMGRVRGPIRGAATEAESPIELLRMGRDEEEFDDYEDEEEEEDDDDDDDDDDLDKLDDGADFDDEEFDDLDDDES